MVWADGLGLRALDCFPIPFKEVYIGVCTDLEASGFHTKSSGPFHRSSQGLYSTDQRNRASRRNLDRDSSKLGIILGSLM